MEIILKVLATILLCASLAACSKEEVVSTGVVPVTTFAIHYGTTHNATSSMQCAKNTKEKYDNLSDKEKIGKFSLKLFKGVVASQECEISQLKYADALSKSTDIGKVPLPNTCFEGGRIPAMEAVTPAVMDFMVPECSNDPAFKGGQK